MSYKTIVVHVDQSMHAPQRIRIAAEIALRDNAHLTGVAMTGISRYLLEGDVANQHEPVLVTHLGYLRQQAEQALAHYEETVRRMGVLSWEKRLEAERRVRKSGAAHPFHSFITAPAPIPTGPAGC